LIFTPGRRLGLLSDAPPALQTPRREATLALENHLFAAFHRFRFLLPVLPRGFKLKVRILYFNYVGRYERRINGERFVKKLLALPRVSGRARRDSAAQVD
jgi:hypothetical protein